jgi:hypothetical protein
MDSEEEEEEDTDSTTGDAKEHGICFADFLKLSEKALQKGLRDGALTGSSGSRITSAHPSKSNAVLNDGCDGSSAISPSKRIQPATLIESPSASSMQQQRCVWEDSIPSLLCRRCFQFDCIAHRKSQINGDGGEQCMLRVNDVTLRRAKDCVPSLAALPSLDVVKMVYIAVRVCQLPPAPHEVRAAAVAFLHPGDKTGQSNLQRVCKVIEDRQSVASLPPSLGPQCPKDGSDKKYPLSFKQATNLVLKKRTEAEGQLYALVPCACVGGCGHEDCSCSSRGHYCDRFCKCPSDCPMRYPGCHCSPGHCFSKSCACVALGRECDPILCQCQCPAHDSECSSGCKNMVLQERYIPHANSAIAPVPGLHLSISEIPGAGWGLFTTRPVSKGQLICEYSGERIGQEEADRRGLICDRFNQSYLFQADKETVIDAQRFGNVARFINHSEKKPNCLVRVVQVGGVHTVCIFAALDIDAGRELFFDYNHGRAGLAPDWLEKERDKAAELLSLREQTKKQSNGKQVEQGRGGKQKQGRNAAAAALPANARKKQKNASSHNDVSVSKKKKKSPVAADSSDAPEEN